MKPIPEAVRHAIASYTLEAANAMPTEKELVLACSCFALSYDDGYPNLALLRIARNTLRLVEGQTGAVAAFNDAIQAALWRDE